MQEFLIVMLIWGGSYKGGPATITGFETMEACEAARTVIVRTLDQADEGWSRASCLRLRKK